MDLVEIARDAGAHLDRIHRDEAADIFVLIGDAALDRLGHRHGRRGGGPPPRRLALPAAGQDRREQDKGGGEPRIRERESWDLAASKLLMLQCGKIHDHAAAAISHEAIDRSGPADKAIGSQSGWKTCVRPAGRRAPEPGPSHVPPFPAEQDPNGDAIDDRPDHGKHKQRHLVAQRRPAREQRRDRPLAEQQRGAEDRAGDGELGARSPQARDR